MCLATDARDGTSLTSTDIEPRFRADIKAVGYRFCRILAGLFTGSAKVTQYTAGQDLGQMLAAFAWGQLRRRRTDGFRHDCTAPEGSPNLRRYVLSLIRLPRARQRPSPTLGPSVLVTSEIAIRVETRVIRGV